MKKIFIIIAILGLLCGQADATVYYGGNSTASTPITSDLMWFEAVTGSCAGDGSPVAWATVNQAGNKLVANGCTVVIPNTADLTINAALSNKETNTPDADCVDGGQFTLIYPSANTITFLGDIEAGGTTGACLAIADGSNPASLRDVVVFGTADSRINITGGSAANCYGVSDARSNGEGNSRITVHALITGGTFSTAYGYYDNHGSGTTVFDGNATGGTLGHGLQIANSGTATMTGNCIAHATGNSTGCNVSGNGGLTFTGNCRAGDRVVGCMGKITWAGGPSNYFSFDGGGTPVYLSIAPPLDKVLTSKAVVDSTDGSYDNGTATTGGGCICGF